ncbi:hypothetical protein GF351_02680 [Candidatus Woesearchaeota archaeon]|nr:hypothetical protein [Candidatus Woesearchaeota archaeon]
MVSDIANPRQTVLVTSSSDSKDDIITLDWHMPTSFKPLMYAISVGKTRYSRKLIEQAKVFVVNFMPIHTEKEVLFCGRNPGEHVDKFKETGFHRVEGEKVDCPRISEALAFLECEVVKEIETGDHIIFVGNVLHKDWNDTGKRLFHTGKDDFTTTKD